MLIKFVNVSGKISLYHHPEDSCSLVKCSAMKVCGGLSLCAQWCRFILLDEAWWYHSYLLIRSFDFCRAVFRLAHRFMCSKLIFKDLSVIQQTELKETNMRFTHPQPHASIISRTAVLFEYLAFLYSVSGLFIQDHDQNLLPKDFEFQPNSYNWEKAHMVDLVKEMKCFIPNQEKYCT